MWDEQLVGEVPELQTRAEPAVRIKTRCYHGRTEQGSSDINVHLGQSVQIGSCGQVVRRDGRGPVTVEGRHHVLPKSYSPPAARSSWEDRELWARDWNQEPADPGSSRCSQWADQLLHSDLPGRIFYPPSLSPPAVSGSWCSRCKGSLEIRQGWVTRGHITKTLAGTTGGWESTAGNTNTWWN